MEEKTRKITLRKIIKWILLTVSLLVYCFTFARIFVSCDAEISDDILLTATEKSEFENLSVDYPLFNYQPSSWTNDDGSVQIKNIHYIESIKELQLTVRYKKSEFENKTNTPFEFKIRIADGDTSVKAEEDEKLYQSDLEGITLESVEGIAETRFDYEYIRLCASGVEIDNGESKTERVQIVDEDGNVTYTTKTTIEGGNKVYLDIYDSETDELYYSFVVAGKGVSSARLRRSKVDIRIID